VITGRLGRKGLTTLAALRAACVIGAGFNGASFLDFSQDVSSLIMALLAGVAIGCYATVLFALPRSHDSRQRPGKQGGPSAAATMPAAQIGEICTSRER
jgi:hypothetical protein